MITLPTEEVVKLPVPLALAALGYEQVHPKVYRKLFLDVIHKDYLYATIAPRGLSPALHIAKRNKPNTFLVYMAIGNTRGISYIAVIQHLHTVPYYRPCEELTEDEIAERLYQRVWADYGPGT